jgi:hypothetical protein
VKKFILLMIIFSMILLLCGSYITLDWTSLILNYPKVTLKALKYSEIAKLSVSFLCACIVFLIGKDGYKKEETTTLQNAFIAIFIGDLLFFFDFEYMAVVAFCIAHVLLIIRNGAGIKAFFRTSGLKSEKNKIFLIALGSLLVYMSIIVFIFYPELQGQKTLYLVMVYAFLLCISLWIAWSSIIIGYMPPINAIITAIGMSFFFLCDLTVGINFCFNEGLLKTIAPYIIWTFYTPALVLISFSGYKTSSIIRKNSLRW